MPAGNHSAHRQCRRRSQPASLANDARPLLHLQNARYAGEPEHLPGRRFEIRRTVHSLLMAMRHFNPTFHFIAPEELKMPEGTRFTAANTISDSLEYTDFITEEIIADADILYATRVQRERFTRPLLGTEMERISISCATKCWNIPCPNLRILHPLPVSTR